MQAAREAANNHEAQYGTQATVAAPGDNSEKQQEMQATLDATDSNGEQQQMQAELEAAGNNEKQQEMQAAQGARAAVGSNETQ